MKASAKRRLREFRAPDEVGAEHRAWDVARSAYLEREATLSRRPRWRLAIAPVVAVIIAALALSPAGATVRRFITQTLGEKHAEPALFALPSPGRILVSGPGGTWIAAADGSTRSLGSWSQASWSPHGLFVAVAAGDRLAAVDPHGTVHWALARPDVADPRWFSPSGYRVAYLSAGTLRIVDGDGTDDRLLATGVAHIAPAWRPAQALGPFELAYLTARGRVVVRDADTGRILWSAAPGPRPRELLWSADGRRLLVLSAHAARTYAANGTRLSQRELGLTAAASDGALSPDGRKLALVLGGREVVVADADSSHPAMRQVLGVGGVEQLSWSPDGRWLLVSLPAANQWVFVRVAGAPRVQAVSRIVQQFSNGPGQGFPQLEGWCCTVQGQAG